MRYLLFTLALLLVGCSEPSPDSSTQLQPVSDDVYAGLDGESRYQVLSKLLGTLYQGVPVREFFDLREGLETPVSLPDAPNLQWVRTKLITPTDYYSGEISYINEKYFADNWRKSNTRAYAMALLFELPLSREYYHRWMAYTLANSILFSPALELDSVDHTDVEAVFNRLSFAIDRDEPIRDIVYEHMISEENWRRFRSPEDNTREMMEIFLQRFVDAEVPKASQACRNWSLTDDSEGYQLRISQDVNLVAQTDLLDRNDIVGCEEFYRALADHAQLIPVISRRLVDHFFAGSSVEQREAIAAELAATNPIRFQDLFNTLLFSQAYLLRAERTKTLEESFFGTAHRIYYYAGRDLFRFFTDDNPASGSPELAQMRQAALTYKLGRQTSVPLDTLSLAYYHKRIRDDLLLDRRTTSDVNNQTDGGWRTTFLENEDDRALTLLTGQDFIHYLMLSGLGRRASETEMSELLTLIEQNNLSGNKTAQTLLVFDYISRLAEFYVHPALQE